MYDIFISYRRDGGYATARLLYERLKVAGLNPFFDLEELRSGPFNVRLYKTIDECTNFILVLPPNALNRCKNDGDWLRLEIERALQGNKNIIPVMIDGFNWDNLPSNMSSLSNYNGVILSREYFDASVQKIISMLQGVRINVADSQEKPEYHRKQNTYFDVANKKESKRLIVQQNLMKSFDASTFEKISYKYDSLRVLDLGSNDGAFIMDRLSSSGKITKLIGVEYDKDTVELANKKYGQENDILFVQSNMEEEIFVDILKDAMAKCNIENFNVVNISMIILHLKNPFRLLKTIRPFLEKGASIIIKDIDDGFNIAYPDPKKEFERVFRICENNETSGYRHSGRQIFTLLKQTGYRNIALEKLCMTTVGMDFDQKEALFETYFSFILEDLKIMVERYPNNKSLKDDLYWYEDAYEQLEEEFQNESFFFALGFIIFTANK